MTRTGFLDFDEARAQVRGLLARAPFGCIDRGTKAVE